MGTHLIHSSRHDTTNHFDQYNAWPMAMYLSLQKSKFLFQLVPCDDEETFIVMVVPTPAATIAASTSVSKVGVLAARTRAVGRSLIVDALAVRVVMIVAPL
jgi:hypothetical protein